MSKVTTKLDSQIFSSTRRRQAFSNFVSRQSKDFKNLTRRRMIEGTPSGRLYSRAAGAGFTRSHRASRRGQRPAVDTGTLAQAISDKRTGEFSAEVYIVPKVNSQSGVTADKYGEILQTKLDRQIMTATDALEAERKIGREGQVLIASLV